MKNVEKRAKFDNFELEYNYDFTDAVRGRFYKPKKVPTSMRLDNDILLFLKKKQVKFLLSIFFVVVVFAQSVVAGEYAQAANDNPFLNGELNPKYEGEVIALAGEVLEIQPTKQKFPVYKLNLRINGIKNIWVTSIAPQPEGGIKVGDMIIFKGFITKSSSTDSTGELGKIIGSETLLIAARSQRVK